MIIKQTNPSVFDYLREIISLPMNHFKDLVGKAWAMLYLMVAFILIATLVNKLPGVEIDHLISGVSLAVLLTCLGIAIKTSPNLKTWVSPGRAELLGFISAFGLLGFLINAV